MAYVQDEEQQGTPGAGGQVLAGSGGAKTGTGQVAGTGFTNLQKYLGANQGQGQDIAGDITSQGQQSVDAAKTAANAKATEWADRGVREANNGSQGTAYSGPQDVQGVQGYNDLDQAYQNVKNTATNFANDRMTQQAGLQNKYGYGSGFAALDTFLGRQDGREKIQGWAAGVDPGSAQGQIDRVNNAIAAGRKTSAANKQSADIEHMKTPEGAKEHSAVMEPIVAQSIPSAGITLENFGFPSLSVTGPSSPVTVSPQQTPTPQPAQAAPPPAQPTQPVRSIPSSVGKGAPAPMPVRTVNETPVGKGAATSRTTKAAAKPKPTYGRKG